MSAGSACKNTGRFFFNAAPLAWIWQRLFKSGSQIFNEGFCTSASLGFYHFMYPYLGKQLNTGMWFE